MAQAPSTISNGNNIIESMLRTIEEQDHKLCRLEVLLKENRKRGKQLSQAYERQKQYSEKIESEMERFFTQQKEMFCLRGQIQGLKLQNHDLRVKLNRAQTDDELDKLIKEISESIQIVRNKLIPENHELKQQKKVWKNRVEGMKKIVNSFVERCEDMFLTCDKFEDTLISEIYRLRQTIGI